MARDLPDGPPEPKPAPAIVSLCNVIGRARAACYPTSLQSVPGKMRQHAGRRPELPGPMRHAVQRAVLGAAIHRRLPQPRSMHPVWGLNHSFCNFILSRAFDDCFSAASCTDSPGVWTMESTWKGGRPTTRHAERLSNARQETHRQRTAGRGKWTRHGRDMKLTYSNGCKPVYTGRLNTNRTGLVSGTMKCTVGTNAGTWSAIKTNTHSAAITRRSPVVQSFVFRSTSAASSGPVGLM